MVYVCIMTFGDYKQQVINKLEPQYGMDEAKAMAKMVLSYLFPTHAIHLSNQVFSDAEANEAKKILAKLMSGMPVQYALEEAWFLNRKYKVNASVLIPRPETEELVLFAQKQLQLLQKSPAEISILDVGTGSGCIAISLALAAPYHVAAVDTSTDAIAVAQMNADLQKAPVDFACVDFLDPANWCTFGKYDLVISNPPYIPEQEAALLDKHVTQWEPGIALFVPNEEPLVFYKALINFCIEHLAVDGFLLVECHQQYALEVCNLYTNEIFEALLYKDIFENNRMVLAKKRGHY